MRFSSQLNLKEALAGCLGLLMLSAVIFDRNSYRTSIEKLNGAQLEVIESDISKSNFTIICHGYAGSNEMMRQLAFDISRAGSNVVLFDFIGHGKSQELLVNKPEQIEGTTQQLVEQLEAVIKEIRKLFGDEVSISLVGHSMASDIVVRASKNNDISSVIAISPYSNAISEDFPNDLLLISGHLETHLRASSLDHVVKIDRSATENQTVFKENFRRKASYIDNTGHVSVIYAPHTAKEIIDWLGLSSNQRTLATTHIIWVIFAFVLLLRFSTKLLQETKTNGKDQRISMPKATAVIFVGSVAGVFFSGFDLKPSTIFGFYNLASFFTAFSTALILIFMWQKLKFYWVFDLWKFVKLVMLFCGICFFINTFVGFFHLHSYRYLAFIILIVPVTFFCVFSEQVINGRNQWFVLLIRMTPIIGLIFCIVLYPSKFGLMFTIIPIYCLYFSVFGYAGKHFRKYAGPFPVGISHGIFLSYAFAATTPMFSP